LAISSGSRRLVADSSNRYIQGDLSTACNEHVIHTFLDKTLCRGEAHAGRSASYDGNLVGQFPANVPLSSAVCPGFSLDENVVGESRLDCSAHNCARLDVAEATQQRKGNPHAKSQNRSNA
jgi:hypothetical protein